MSRLMFTIIAALALTWASGAAAQLKPDDTVDPSVDVGALVNTIPNFPYRNCTTSSGAYQLAPGVKSLGGGKYCFTIRVNNPQSCTGPCCAADLKKIEFDVQNSCVAPGAGVKATINGAPTPAGAAFYRTVYGPSEAAVLRLSFLGLDTVTARDAELCLTLTSNRGGQGCNTLEKLCVSPPGTPSGTCVAAFYDSPCKCCPVSQTFVPPPPSPAPSPLPPSPQPPSLPPSQPPSPPPPFVFINCPSQVCITAQLLPPMIDVRPYRYDSAACASIQQQIADSMNAMLDESGIPMKSYFAPDPTQCSGTVAAVCGVFSNPADLQKPGLTEDVQALVPYWIDVASGGNICQPELEGYAVQVTTSNHACLNIDSSMHCDPPLSPFPNCTCNVTQGTIPFTVSPRYFPGKSGPYTDEYCFAVNVLSPDQIVPSSCGAGGDKLTKIEFYANQNMSSSVKAINLYPATGPAVKLSPSWGGQAAYALKATPINWSTAQANGGLVCVEIKKGKTMADICLGFGGQCTTSTFNALKTCCPTFRTALEIP